jgi:phospholipase C
VNSTVFDNTSILKLIEWRWNLKPLTARDASTDIGNLAFALDLAHPDTTVPRLPNPEPPSGVPLCPTFSLPDEIGLEDLLDIPLGLTPNP